MSFSKNTKDPKNQEYTYHKLAHYFVNVIDQTINLELWSYKDEQSYNDGFEPLQTQFTFHKDDLPSTVLTNIATFINIAETKLSAMI